MLVEAILHQPTRAFIFPLSRRDICVRIRARKGDVKECRLRSWNIHRESEAGGRDEPMTCFARDDRFDHFETVVHTQQAARYLKYYFTLVDSEGIAWYVAARGVSTAKPDRHYFYFPGANEGDVLSVPRWPRGAVFYQIFPDSFRNGDPSNDPPDVRPWGEKPSRLGSFGGDLRGIIGKVDYLADLGIGALYLNPVFLSESNHKYDTTDYLSIDRRLGLREDLVELVSRCHARKIRVLLDGVFNHCGLHFEPFQDFLKYGESSPYRDWFIVDGFPVVTDPPNYECFGNYGRMPKLRTANPALRAYLLRVVRYWMEETGIDGWRLDVADEVERHFWVEFRQTVKSIAPEAFLIGETWTEAQDLLRGDQMDSVMNYPFTELAVDFFALRTIGPSVFDAGLNRLIALYPGPVVSILYNPLDSHDTPRFLRLCSDDVSRFMLAVGFQMTFPGIPAVYYGDEIGLSGGNDPECRGSMNWDPERQNPGIVSWYKRLIALRKSRTSLSHGDFLSIVCDDRTSVYGFIRRHEDEATYVVLNNSDRDQEVVVPVCEGGGSMMYRDLLTGSVHKASEISNARGMGLQNGDILPYGKTITVRLARSSIGVLAAAGQADRPRK